VIFRIAWRNIWRNKMRSLVIILSVAIGLFAGIAVLALYKGILNSRIHTVIYAETGHLQIHHKLFKQDNEPQFIIHQGEALLAALKKNSTVKLFTTRTITQGMLATSTGSAGVKINGIIPGKEDEVSGLANKIIAGKGFDPTKKNQVFIGKKLADKMKLKTGGKLVLTFTDVDANMISAAFRVAAIYQSDNAPLDERNVYVQQSELNQMLTIGNAFHEICIILQNDALTDIVRQQLQQQYPEQLIESWKDISPETDLMIDTVDTTSYIIIGIILFALAFGIVNTMLMAILERTQEIGVMMALGMNRIRLFLLVFLETVFLTLIGTPVGLAVAWILTLYYQQHGLNWSSAGEEVMRSFGFSSMIYPEFPTEKIVAVICIVLFTALASCIYPAIKALQLQPVEALRK